MLNREKFLGKLNINTYISRCSLIGGTAETKTLLLESDNMLCDMVESAMQFSFYATGHYAKGNTEKWKINYNFFMKLKLTIEKATGKTWEEILKIAEECQE